MDGEGVPPGGDSAMRLPSTHPASRQTPATAKMPRFTRATVATASVREMSPEGCGPERRKSGRHVETLVVRRIATATNLGRLASRLLIQFVGTTSGRARVASPAGSLTPIDHLGELNARPREGLCVRVEQPVGDPHRILQRPQLAER